MLKVGFWISIGNLIFYLLYSFFGLNLLALLPDMETWCNAKIIIAYLIASISILGLIMTILAIKKDNNIKKWMVVVSILVSFFMIVYQVDFALKMQESKQEIIEEFNN